MRPKTATVVAPSRAAPDSDAVQGVYAFRTCLTAGPRRERRCGGQSGVVGERRGGTGTSRGEEWLWILGTSLSIPNGEPQPDLCSRPDIDGLRILAGPMPTVEQLQTSPRRERLQAIAGAVHSGARVTRVTRMLGDLNCGVHRISLYIPGGAGETVILRRYTDDDLPAHARATIEWKILQLLPDLGVAAPVPLVNDATGALCGSPGIVVSYLPGRPLLIPRDSTRWASQLAGALAQLHRASREVQRPEFLPRLDVAGSDWVMSASPPPERIIRHPDGPALVVAIREQAKALVETPGCLVHTDYWPGNTIWNGNTLTGIVDWAWARWGDPAYDVAYACLDMQLTGCDEEAEIFLSEYERLMGSPVPNFRYYALLCCARPMPDPAIWLPGWHEFGLTGLTEDSVRRGLTRAIQAAIALPA